MLISTKGRYALRVMLDLMECGDGYVPLTEIAERQQISEKYLEGIIAMLSRAGLVKSLRGKGGGYCAVRSAEEYTVGEILRITEGSLAPVTCLEEGAAVCPRSGECRTLPMWEKLHRTISNFLDSVTLASILDGMVSDDYNI